MIELNELRKAVQTTLTTMVGREIARYSCGVPKPDSAVTGTYFGYDLSVDYSGSDFDNNYNYNIRLNGILVRPYNPTENTIKTVDEALDQLLKKLKNANFKCNVNTINLDNEYRKLNVTGTVKYSELQNLLIR